VASQKEERKGRTNRLATPEEREEGDRRVREAVKLGKPIELPAWGSLVLTFLAVSIEGDEIRMDVVAHGEVSRPGVKARSQGKTVHIRIPAKVERDEILEEA
jgi:hypothetical protein